MIERDGLRVLQQYRSSRKHRPMLHWADIHVEAIAPSNDVTDVAQSAGDAVFSANHNLLPRRSVGADNV